MKGPKRGSGPRSNMYSENKFSNWARFDPFSTEAYQASKVQEPHSVVRRGPDQQIRVFEMPLKRGFVRPYCVEDICQVLSDVPMEYLRGLTDVFLLGGSAKQSRSHRMYRYGLYYSNQIWLVPTPTTSLTQFWRNPPRPSTIREYTRFGASFAQVEGQWVLRFTAQSLRLFFLYDVLLHEIGHHNERPNRRGHRASERFANWFAQYQSLRLLKKE